MKTRMDKLVGKRTKKSNGNSKKWKNSLFREIRMIPQLDSGPLQYRLGNLGDIVCLTQKFEGRLNLFLVSHQSVWSKGNNCQFLHRTVVLFKYFNFYENTVLRFFSAGFDSIIPHE